VRGSAVNILIVKPSSLGDVIHAFPAVRLLKARFPEATLSWVVNDTYADLVGLCPDVAHALAFRRHRWAQPRRWSEVIGFVRGLRAREFTVAVDLQGLLRSGLIARFSGAPRRVGFAAAREGAARCYTERVLTPANVRHAVDRNVFLVRSAFGIADATVAWSLRSAPDAQADAAALLGRHRLEGHRPLIGVAPAARWPSKTWPPEFFADVIGRVSAGLDGAAFWLCGSESERAVGEAVRAAGGDARPVSLMGESNLLTMVELLRRTDVLLTNDSGPMHVAAAVGTPTVALFGPTDPALTGPYGSGHRVFQGHCPHGPCFERTCPAATPGCQRSVSAAAVAAAVVEAGRRGKAPDRPSGPPATIPG